MLRGILGRPLRKKLRTETKMTPPKGRLEICQASVIAFIYTVRFKGYKACTTQKLLDLCTLRLNYISVSRTRP